MTRARPEARAGSARVRGLVSQRSHLADLAQGAALRFPWLRDAVVRVARGDSGQRYEEWIAAYDTVGEMQLAALADTRRSFSILVPDGRPEVVDRFDGCDVTAVASSDPEEWNAALRQSTAEYCLVLDPAVELRPHALPFFAQAIADSPDAFLFYADEDVIDGQGRRSRHDFKPDWNEALFRSQNYLGGVVCFRRRRAIEVGGCEQELDGDCFWGLLLKLTAGAPAGSVRHLPFVLSHRWADEPRPEPRERVATAVEQRLGRVGDDAEVEPVGEAGYLVRYALRESPKVSIIVPSTADLDVLRPCVDGILQRTSYADFELLVVANGVPEGAEASHALLRAIAGDARADVLFYEDGPYNFSALNNWAAEHAQGEFLCFLNDDTEVIESGWLGALVGEALRDRVAAVGALLLYANGRIQHAGCILGAGGVAAHAYHGRLRGTSGYHGRALLAQDVSAVTAACMLVKRAEFLAVGGFDEELAVAYNDVDLCLRLRKAGRRIVWTPAAALQHNEGASLRRHYVGETRAEWARGSELMQRRWGDQLLADPYYNPNLSLDPLLLWEPAFPPRVRHPWRPAEPDPAIRPVVAAG
jgi:GT2 family glycosyltransferase